MDNKNKNIVTAGTDPATLTEVRPSLKPNEIKRFVANMSGLGPHQAELFHVEKQIEHEGVEMGVLDNGVPYLSESGLARMCGIDRKVLNRLAVNWKEERTKPRGTQIAGILAQAGFVEDNLFLKSEMGGKEINAYTEPVCLALLEYYAYVSEDPRPEATRAFRSLARVTFRSFVYDAVGYAPKQSLIDSWQHFHDRIDATLDAVPNGYFSVFREIASIIVPMIRAGIIINDKMVPDISVGLAWAAFWKENNLGEAFGDRVKFLSSYPDYYPQAASNPQEANAYPDGALGVFRAWLRDNYLANKFPKYLLGKTKDGTVEKHVATAAIGALAPRQLPANR